MPETRNPTEQELNVLQEHLWETWFKELLEQLEAFHGVKIWEIISDEPTTDPRWYSLE